jgi:AcrR family transcriptional regulator
MNRVMATQTVSEPISLQDEHVATTRKRILDAAAELIIEEHPATLSMLAIAKRAGVSVRTVYRHFPNKEALLDAIAEIGNEETVSGFAFQELRLDNLHEFTAQLWGELVHTRALVQAQSVTPFGHELRKKRADRRRRIIERVLAEEHVDLPPEDHRRLVALIAHLMSRDSLFELTDLLGLSVDDAAALVTWTIRTVVDAARRSKEVGH